MAAESPLMIIIDMIGVGKFVFNAGKGVIILSVVGLILVWILILSLI